METRKLVTETPTTPEATIARVRRQLKEDDSPHGMRVSAEFLDGLADSAVRELWSSRVKTFVPVLALRQARRVAS